MKTIRTRRQRETDYDNDEKQLLEILLFDRETSGIWLTFWDSEQIKVIEIFFELFNKFKNHLQYLSLLNNGHQKNILFFVLVYVFVMMNIGKFMD